MKVISYQITLLEPALVTALDGDPNSAVAHDYLPGSVLRGVVIGAYLRANERAMSDLDAADPTTRRLFFNGSTRYLNGYPLDRLGQRTLPVPLSWQQEKGAVAKQTKEQPAPVFDFAIESVEEEGSQWKGVSEPFCALFADDQVRLVKPERLIAVHTQRSERRFGRPLSEEGAVFRYDSLAAGQTFGAIILCGDADVNILLPCLEGEVTLGGSRTGGYGRARLEKAKEEKNWREVGGDVDHLSVEDGLIVTLLSDALIRNPGAGQFTVEAGVIKQALEARLGCALSNPHAFMSGQPVGGFNRKWGLPLPQALAVRMGSVFVFELPACTADKLAELEDKGIGERRAEGFGRVAVNWHGEAELKVEGWIAPPKPEVVSVPTGTPDEALAQAMTKRLLRQKLEGQLTARANELGKHVKQPSASQLSRLREVIQDALLQEPNEGRGRLKTYFDQLEKRQVTRKQFSDDRLDGKPLLRWLRERTAAEDNSWQEVKIPQIGDVRAELTPQLIYEYNLRLMEAVLAQAAKNKRMKER